MQYNAKKEATRLDLQLSEAILDLTNNNENAINIGLVTTNRAYKIVPKSNEVTEYYNKLIKKVKETIKDPKQKKIMISKLLFAYKYCEIELMSGYNSTIIVATVKDDKKFSLVAKEEDDSLIITTQDSDGSKRIYETIYYSTKELDQDIRTTIIKQRQTTRTYNNSGESFIERETITNSTYYDKDNKVISQKRDNRNHSAMIVGNDEVTIDYIATSNSKLRCKANEKYILGIAYEDVDMSLKNHSDIEKKKTYYYIATNDCPSLIHLDCTNSRCIISEDDFEKYMDGELDVDAKYKDYEKEYTFGFIKSMINKKDDSNE